VLVESRQAQGAAVAGDHLAVVLVAVNQVQEAVGLVGQHGPVIGHLDRDDSLAPNRVVGELRCARVVSAEGGVVGIISRLQHQLSAAAQTEAPAIRLEGCITFALVGVDDDAAVVDHLDFALEGASLQNVDIGRRLHLADNGALTALDHTAVLGRDVATADARGADEDHRAAVGPDAAGLALVDFTAADDQLRFGGGSQDPMVRLPIGHEVERLARAIGPHGPVVDQRPVYRSSSVV